MFSSCLLVGSGTVTPPRVDAFWLETDSLRWLPWPGESPTGLGAWWSRKNVVEGDEDDDVRRAMHMHAAAVGRGAPPPRFSYAERRQGHQQAARGNPRGEGEGDVVQEGREDVGRDGGVVALHHSLKIATAATTATTRSRNRGSKSTPAICSGAGSRPTTTSKKPRRS